MRFEKIRHLYQSEALGKVLTVLLSLVGAVGFILTVISTILVLTV